MYNDIIIEILPFPVKFAKEETVSKKKRRKLKIQQIDFIVLKKIVKWHDL